MNRICFFMLEGIKANNPFQESNSNWRRVENLLFILDFRLPIDLCLFLNPYLLFNCWFRPGLMIFESLIHRESTFLPFKLFSLLFLHLFLRNLNLIQHYWKRQINSIKNIRGWSKKIHYLKTMGFWLPFQKD